MFKRLGGSVLACFVLFLACGDDEAPPTGTLPTIEELADCTCPNFESFVGAFEASLDLRGAVQDPLNLPSSVDAYSPITGEFTVTIDLDDNAVPDGQLSGTIRNPQNFNDGIQVNEAIVAVWDLVYGNITGSGVFSTVRLGASSYRLTIVEVNPTLTGGSCGFEVTSLGLHYDLQDLDTRGPWGTMEFKTSMDTRMMSGLLTAAQDTDWVSVSAQSNGQSTEFKIDMNTFEVVW